MNDGHRNNLIDQRLIVTLPADVRGHLRWLNGTSIALALIGAVSLASFVVSAYSENRHADIETRYEMASAADHRESERIIGSAIAQFHDEESRQAREFDDEQRRTRDAYQHADMNYDNWVEYVRELTTEMRLHGLKVPPDPCQTKGDCP